MAVVSAGLPSVLASLRDRAGLSRRRLATQSGVSEGTIKLIEGGMSERPHPETLRLLAAGLATHRMSGRADPQQAETIYATLMDAAGYLPTAAPPAEGDLPPDIEAYARQVCGAEEGLLRAVLANLAGRPAEGQRSTLRFLAQAMAALDDATPRRSR